MEREEEEKETNTDQITKKENMHVPVVPKSSKRREAKPPPSLLHELLLVVEVRVEVGLLGVAAGLHVAVVLVLHHARAAVAVAVLQRLGLAPARETL